MADPLDARVTLSMPEVRQPVEGWRPPSTPVPAEPVSVDLLCRQAVAATDSLKQVTAATATVGAGAGSSPPPADATTDGAAAALVGGDVATPLVGEAALAAAAQSFGLAAAELRQTIDVLSLLKGSRSSLPKLFQAIPLSVDATDEAFVDARVVVNVARKRADLAAAASALRTAHTTMTSSTPHRRTVRSTVAALAAAWPVKCRAVAPFPHPVPCIPVPRAAEPVVLLPSSAPSSSCGVDVRHPLLATPLTLRAALVQSSSGGVLSCHRLPPAATPLPLPPSTPPDTAAAHTGAHAQVAAVTHSAVCSSMMKGLLAQAHELVSDGSGRAAAASASDGFDTDKGTVWWAATWPPHVQRRVAHTVPTSTLRVVETSSGQHLHVSVSPEVDLLVELQPVTAPDAPVLPASTAEASSCTEWARDVVGLFQAETGSDGVPLPSLGRAVSLVRHRLRLQDVHAAVGLANATLSSVGLAIRLVEADHAAVHQTWRVEVIGDAARSPVPTFTVEATGPVVAVITQFRSRTCGGPAALASVLADVAQDVNAWAPNGK